MLPCKFPHLEGLILLLLYLINARSDSPPFRQVAGKNGNGKNGNGKKKKSNGEGGNGDEASSSSSSASVSKPSLGIGLEDYIRIFQGGNAIDFSGQFWGHFPG